MEKHMTENLKDTDIKAGIANIFSAITNMADAEEDDAYAAVQAAPLFVDAVVYAKDRDFESFDLLFLNEVKKPIRGLLNSISESDDFKFLMLYSQDIEPHFLHFITQFEGSACCADKSRTIISAMLHHFETGKEISFNYSGEYTYHLSQSIFTDHESIMSFYKGVRRLLITGNPANYLLAVQNMVSNKKVSATNA